MKQLWTELYRPKIIKDYVFRDDMQKTQVQSWISTGAIPHLLFSGVQGTGKTTLAKVLLNELNVDWGDVLIINGSADNGVDYVRDRMSNFATTMGFGEFRYILLDEADYLSHHAQAALRNVMERFSNSCRFILTCVTGDTKVYSPYGYKAIESTMPGDLIASPNGSLQSKTLVKSKSDDVYKITTSHGFEIRATGQHKFLTLGGERLANTLNVGESLPISLKQLYGNSFSQSDNSLFFDVDDFCKFLSDKGILTNDKYDGLFNQKHFLFSKSQQEIFDYIVDNKINTVNSVVLADTIKVPQSKIRNLFSKIDQYIIKKGYIATSTFQYELDLEKLIKDYDEFISNVDTSKTLLNYRNYQTQEDICKQLPVFDDDLVLSMGRLIGFLEGDGHTSSIIHCDANNETTLRLVHHDIQKIIPDLDINIKKNGPNSKGLCTTYNNKILHLLFEYFGATYGNKSKTVRHLSKFCDNKLFFKGFIQAFYDSDGKQFKICNDLLCSPMLLEQSICSNDQIVFFEEIALKLKEHFDINVDTSINDSELCSSTFSGLPKYMNMHTGKNNEIIKYLECIGNYYDKNTIDDILGYLYYMKTFSTYGFLRFSEWKHRYYRVGLINDPITSIEKMTVILDVFDCSFDNYHWYITNGFVSHNCNYPHKIIPAIHSRCQGFHIDKLDKTEFTARVATILLTENVKLELETLDLFVSATYPDMRKCINLCQQNSLSGELQPMSSGEGGADDYRVQMIALFRQGKYQKARLLICSQIALEEYDSVYRFLYDNLDIWADNYEKTAAAILIIRNGLVKHSACGDPEINLSACLIELELLAA